MSESKVQQVIDSMSKCRPVTSGWVDTNDGSLDMNEDPLHLLGADTIQEWLALLKESVEEQAGETDKLVTAFKEIRRRCYERKHGNANLLHIEVCDVVDEVLGNP